MFDCGYFLCAFKIFEWLLVDHLQGIDNDQYGIRISGELLFLIVHSSCSEYKKDPPRVSASPGKVFSVHLIILGVLIK